MNGYHRKRIEGLRKVLDKLTGLELKFVESMLERVEDSEYELSDKQNHVLNKMCEQHRV